MFSFLEDKHTLWPFHNNTLSKPFEPETINVTYEQSANFFWTWEEY